MKNFRVTLIVIGILAVSQIFANRCDTHRDCPSGMDCYANQTCGQRCETEIFPIETALKRPERCTGNCVNRCDTHAQCPLGMDCYTDHTCRDPPNRCTGELCGQPCDTHKDCPADQNCYTDKTCRDPCKYSIHCGKEADCRNVDYQPECYCPTGTIGDPAKECFDIKRVCAPYSIQPRKLN